MVRRGRVGGGGWDGLGEGAFLEVLGLGVVEV